MTAYRRVHEVIASTFDRIIEARRSGGSPSNLLVDLSRCLVMVKYQLARGQLSEGLANLLTTLLTQIINRARASQSDLEQVVSRARTLIDALAVIVFRLGKK